MNKQKGFSQRGGKLTRHHRLPPVLPVMRNAMSRRKLMQVVKESSTLK